MEIQNHTVKVRGLFLVGGRRLDAFHTALVLDTDQGYISCDFSFRGLNFTDTGRPEDQHEFIQLERATTIDLRYRMDRFNAESYGLWNNCRHFVAFLSAMIISRGINNQQHDGLWNIIGGFLRQEIDSNAGTIGGVAMGSLCWVLGMTTGGLASMVGMGVGVIVRDTYEDSIYNAWRRGLQE